MISHSMWFLETMASNRKGTVKLNELRRIERLMQERWEREKVFEQDAPDMTSEDRK